VPPADPRPKHQRTGSHGEEDAYFHLRKLGVVIVARNFRSPRFRGEIDGHRLARRRSLFHRSEDPDIARRKAR
jgi:hypothetical protein